MSSSMFTSSSIHHWYHRVPTIGRSFCVSRFSCPDGSFASARSSTRESSGLVTIDTTRSPTFSHTSIVSSIHHAFILVTMTSSTDVDPTMELPRDGTGSYLHLKLKRFLHQEDRITMAYAHKTWKAHPHDAEIELSTSSTSTCRFCHVRIHKGELRARLWLQCHKGCKNSAYFHAGRGEQETDCIWKYPETAKLESIEEFVGFDRLPLDYQQEMKDQFERYLGVRDVVEKGHPKRKKSPTMTTTTKASSSSSRKKVKPTR